MLLLKKNRISWKVDMMRGRDERMGGIIEVCKLERFYRGNGGGKYFGIMKLVV